MTAGGPEAAAAVLPEPWRRPPRPRARPPIHRFLVAPLPIDRAGPDWAGPDPAQSRERAPGRTSAAFAQSARQWTEPENRT